MENNFTVADFVALMDARVTRIDEILARLENALVGDNHLVRSSPGLYLRRDGDVFIPVGIEDASWWTEEAANRVAANVSNGYGDVAQAVHLHTELRAQRDGIAQFANTYRA